MTLELAHVLGSEAIETATSVPITYARLAGLPVEIESCEFTPMVRDTSSGFTKITTVVRLRGRGEEGLGEDVTWDQIDHIEFLRHPMPHQLEGAWELDELSGALGEMDLFPVAPCRPASRRYRRWAFESAALDLGLRQAGLSLADALGRTPQPVRFVSSVGLGQPPSVEPIRARLQGDPTLEFKLDPTLSWSAQTLRDIAATCRVRIIDLKGHYRNAAVQLPADAPLYARVLDAFPDAWIEDPAVTPETRPVLAEHLERVSWDEPIHSIEDLKTLPGRPGALNIKPARFGSLRALLAAYEFCDATGIVPYGGGMFELGPGRGQLQYLASLFHPDAPNDLAPPSTTWPPSTGRSRPARSHPDHTPPASAGGRSRSGAASATPSSTRLRRPERDPSAHRPCPTTAPPPSPGAHAKGGQMTATQSTHAAPIAHQPDEAEALWFLDMPPRSRRRPRRPAGAWPSSSISHRAARASPLHVHRREDEWFYVTEGELTVWVDGQVTSAPAGTFIYGPRDVPHTFEVASEHARFLLVTEPAGFEQFMRTLAEPARSLTIPPPASEPPDVQHLSAVAAVYGIEILGPPGIPA